MWSRLSVSGLEDRHTDSVKDAAQRAGIYLSNLDDAATGRVWHDVDDRWFDKRTQNASSTSGMVTTQLENAEQSARPSDPCEDEPSAKQAQKGGDDPGRGGGASIQ